MPDTKAPDLNKMVIKAARAGDVEAVRRLLEQDASLVHARDTDASTPLHCAAWKGHPEVVKLLLDHDADVNARNTNDHWGDTPLHAAAHGNQRAVAEILLNRGADIHATNAAGRKPIDETAFHNATAVANLLRKQHSAE